MPSPITPNNLKDKLPNMDAPTVCDRLKRVLVDFPKQVYEFVAYIWDAHFQQCCRRAWKKNCTSSVYA